eukprot:3765210-Pyramimonas_sp.AAC.1
MTHAHLTSLPREERPLEMDRVGGKEQVGVPVEVHFGEEAEHRLPVDPEDAVVDPSGDSRTHIQNE